MSSSSSSSSSSDVVSQSPPLLANVSGDDEQKRTHEGVSSSSGAAQTCNIPVGYRNIYDRGTANIFASLNDQYGGGGVTFKEMAFDGHILALVTMDGRIVEVDVFLEKDTDDFYKQRIAEELRAFRIAKARNNNKRKNPGQWTTD